MFLKKLKRIKDNIGAYKGPHKYVARREIDGEVINAPATRLGGKWPQHGKYPHSKLQTQIAGLQVDQYVRAGIEEFGTKRSLADLVGKASKNRQNLSKTLRALGYGTGVAGAGLAAKKYKDSK